MTEQTTELHPIFRECLGQKMRKYETREPFVLDGTLYATDGAILVRCPAPGEDDTTGRELPPVRDYGPERYSFRDEPLPWLSFSDPPPTEKCERCGGSGTVPERITCSACDGDGVVECNMHYDHECRVCNGYGKYKAVDAEQVACEDCKGKGEVPSERQIRFNGVSLAEHYVRLVQEHGGRLYPSEDLPHRTPVYFRISNSIDGMVMPVNPDDSNVILAEDLTEPTP